MFSPPDDRSPSFLHHQQNNSNQWIHYFNNSHANSPPPATEPVVLNPPLAIQPTPPPMEQRISESGTPSSDRLPELPCSSTTGQADHSVVERDSDKDDDSGPIDIQLRNVVCSFSVPCHVDLKELARKTCHVYYEKSKGVLKKQMRYPKCYISIWSSGKVSIVGCNSEENCMRASRIVTRIMQKLFPKAKLCNYRITNIMATCKLPFGMAEQANQFNSENIKIQYEPELSVGLIWKSKKPKATLRIHTTGSITITGAVSTEGVMSSLENVFPVVKQFACIRTDEPARKKPGGWKRKRIPKDADDYTDGGLEWIDDFEQESSDCDDSDFDDYH